jgi:hypothetical protein
MSHACGKEMHLRFIHNNISSKLIISHVPVILFERLLELPFIICFSFAGVSEFMSMTV